MSSPFVGITQNWDSFFFVVSVDPLKFAAVERMAFPASLFGRIVYFSPPAMVSYVSSSLLKPLSLGGDGSSCSFAGLFSSTDLVRCLPFLLAKWFFTVGTLFRGGSPIVVWDVDLEARLCWTVATTSLCSEAPQLAFARTLAPQMSPQMLIGVQVQEGVVQAGFLKIHLV